MLAMDGQGRKGARTETHDGEERPNAAQSICETHRGGSILLFGRSERRGRGRGR